VAYCEAEDKLECRPDYPFPALAADEALIKVRIAGICSIIRAWLTRAALPCALTLHRCSPDLNTCCLKDLEIIKGYVHGQKHVLGQEFVGHVESS
jgi:D-arabinose 1-dehydrogenase-like Zn-dependent alcohol dehydrogenase